MKQVDPPSSRAPLVELQTIVLQEAFALYRSRDPGVYKSPAFSALYSSVGRLFSILYQMIYMLRHIYSSSTIANS